MPTKKCRDCGEVKSTDAFGASTSRGKTFSRGSCKKCCTRARNAKAPLPTMPEGMELKTTGTKVDDAGNVIEQWIGTRTESTSIEPVRPAIPAGHSVKGMSTLVDADGSVRAQWVKTGRDQEDDRRASMLESIATIADRWQGKADPTPAPAATMDKLLTFIPMGDPHIGMMSWKEETGANFDLQIAERNLRRAMEKLVDRSLPTARAALVNIGDFYHSDSRRNQTTAGTPVDVDGRHAKMMGVGVRTMRHLIDYGLTKFGQMDVFNMGGNHDADTSQMLAICLAQFYEREPRVNIVVSPAKFQRLVFGKNLLAFTHQDTCKIAALPEIMACDWPHEWADTLHRYWWTGHIHHKTVTEMRGCIAESLRTLASTDAWHRAQGYRSGREMQAITYHIEHGEKSRHRVDITEVEMEFGDE